MRKMYLEDCKKNIDKLKYSLSEYHSMNKLHDTLKTLITTQIEILDHIKREFDEYNGKLPKFTIKVKKLVDKRFSYDVKVEKYPYVINRGGIEASLQDLCDTLNALLAREYYE